MSLPHFSLTWPLTCFQFPSTRFQLAERQSGHQIFSPFVLERRRLDPITGQQSQAPVAERVRSRSRLQKSGGSHGLFQINFQSL